MAEHRFDDLQVGAEALQSGGDGPPQIMDAPRRDLGDGVKPSLAAGKVNERIAAVGGEDKVARTNPWQVFEDGESLRCQRDGVDFACLGALAGKDDGVVLDLGPA